MRLTTLAAVCGTMCALAPVAKAATLIDVVNVAMNNPAIVNLSGLGINEDVYDSAFLFTSASGAVFPTFCVDIFHDITLGAVNITYAEQPLTTNSSGSLSGTGTALSATQIGEIGSLADLGAGLIAHGDTNLANDLAGVQAAIWSIEYPALTVSGDPTVTARMAYYETYAAAHPASTATAIYDVTGMRQGQVLGVPEPASWSLMLLGVGAMGAVIRRSRRTSSAAPARYAEC